MEASREKVREPKDENLRGISAEDHPDDGDAGEEKLSPRTVLPFRYHSPFHITTEVDTSDVEGIVASTKHRSKVRALLSQYNRAVASGGVSEENAEALLKKRNESLASMIENAEKQKQRLILSQDMLRENLSLRARAFHDYSGGAEAIEAKKNSSQLQGRTLVAPRLGEGAGAGGQGTHRIAPLAQRRFPDGAGPKVHMYNRLDSTFAVSQALQKQMEVAAERQRSPNNKAAAAATARSPPSTGSPSRIETPSSQAPTPRAATAAAGLARKLAVLTGDKSPAGSGGAGSAASTGSPASSSPHQLHQQLHLNHLLMQQQQQHQQYQQHPYHQAGESPRTAPAGTSSPRRRTYRAASPPTQTGDAGQATAIALSPHPSPHAGGGGGGARQETLTARGTTRRARDGEAEAFDPVAAIQELAGLGSQNDFHWDAEENLPSSRFSDATLDSRRAISALSCSTRSRYFW